MLVVLRSDERLFVVSRRSGSTSSRSTVAVGELASGVVVTDVVNPASADFVPVAGTEVVKFDDDD